MLLVSVYNGDELWKETCQNVYECSKHFDSIFISINKSNIQEGDFRIANDQLKNLTNCKIKLRNEFFGPREHFQEICRDLLKEDFTHVFILCHDDLLIEENLKKIRSLKIEDVNISPIVWINEFGKFEVTEFNLKGLNAISVEEFICREADSPIGMSISGLVLSKQQLIEGGEYFKYFRQGYRFDNFIFTYNHLKKINVIGFPLVKVKIHPQQQGKNVIGLNLALDNLFFWYFHALNASSIHVFRRCIKKVGSFCKNYPNTIFDLIKLNIIFFLKDPFKESLFAMRFVFMLIKYGIRKL